jgi:ATP-dependent RNA helicase RhlB
MTEEHLSNCKFSSFDLPENLIQGIDEAGFIVCTPIQEKTLP